ncbi:MULTISPECIES: pyrroline-5-carboxylate reductase [Kocuria]|uniref:Pyrroline-5-carboxylate reductase n=1 Tax=Kocuria rhizophila (strain ATCC 9341 / DSM 348 / NBRC 103217 / DC2201) TaxID=378753 RepID=B2GH72_KOCRD|nr:MULTISPECIES: pyrroline-5-carboxylate reductase [Kocuria]HAG63296.1 pyrroline-5-carboxylate reductase [Kocuria sp.]ASE11192.1 pyrroline-5-carboxylate reductase [Kocuria rhizophila]MBK4121264.1 pyrroline-5-carboxylate reductase [Kocuria rhizophila]MCC5671559.1 pyrroline-5-carboxylate reductase [Kocuria rhizophila]MDV5998432.1 pyrroline-5-carboxylate reductase [Kocuria rhizophila]
MSETTLTFLGAGSMNGSILRGVLAAGTEAGRVRATTRSASSAEALHEETGVEVFAGESDPEANTQAVTGADVVLLGVKPYAVLDLAREVAPALDPATVVVSVAAGVALDALQKALPDGQPVVRCMPNTPSSVGRGALSVTPGEHTSAEQLARVREVLSTVGTVVEVPEHLIRAVTGVSGSGPAYVFYLAEAMQQAGERLGLDPETARVLAKETVSGAGELLRPDDADPAALRRAVTSPGGTTEQAITTFDEKGLREIVAAGAEASAAKGDEMEKEYGGE